MVVHVVVEVETVPCGVVRVVVPVGVVEIVPCIYNVIFMFFSGYIVNCRFQ